MIKIEVVETEKDQFSTMEVVIGGRKYLSNEWQKLVSDVTKDPKLIDFLKKWSLATGICLSILLLRSMYHRIYRKICKYPPGLFGVPYFGSLFTVAAYGDDKFYTKLLPKYGAITMFQLGNTNMISINDVNLIQTMYNSQYCLKRPQAMTEVCSLNGKLTVSEFGFCNDQWLARKKMCLQAISKIIDKSQLMPHFSHLLNTILYPDIDNNLQEWHLRDTLRNASFNVIFGSLFGKDKILSKTNKDFIEINKGSERVVNAIPVATLPRFFYIPSIFGIKNWIKKRVDKEFEKGYFQFHNSLNKHIEIAMENYKTKSSNDSSDNDDNANNWTLFDELYQNMLNTNGEITSEMLMNDICNLFGAGTETTSMTLEAALLYLCKYKNLQKDIYHELLKHSQGTANEYENNKREFIYDEYLQCIKFRAFINEVLRISCIGAFGMPRSVSKKCVLKFNYNKQNKECENVLFTSFADFNSGFIYDRSSKYEYEYIIDESFILSPNFLYIMRDNKYIWGKNSSKFNINHWITKDGKKNDNNKYNNHNKSMPFGYGRRNCVGQLLAEKEIRILLANLILNYEFRSNDKDVNDENKNIEMDIKLTRFVRNETPLVVKQRKGKTRRYSRDLTDSVKDLGLITPTSNSNADASTK